jgi:transposase
MSCDIEPGWSTNCTRCCGISCPAALQRISPRRTPVGCCPAPGRPGRWSRPVKQLCRDLVTEIKDTDPRLKDLTARIAAAVAESRSSLVEIDGIGPVLAGRFLGRMGRASRFPTAAAFANYAGVAPVEVASADRSRHRLPRGGDQQLNLALHIVALTQVRMPASVGRAYYDQKIAAGKTHNEAMRCLKRRLAARVVAAPQSAAASAPGPASGTAVETKGFRR